MGKDLLGSVELNRIYQMDCLEGMKLLPDKSIDSIICDLPYGSTKCKWDTIIPFDKLWEQYERVIKENGAIILFGSQPFTSLLTVSNLDLFKYELLWEKEQGTNYVLAKKRPLKNYENILVFYKKQPTYNPQMVDAGKGWKSGGYRKDVIFTQLENEIGKEYKGTLRYPLSILKFNRDYGLHPTQKPVQLIEWLIKSFTNEGEIILDNCMGSGTTAVAALNTKRKFIGYEIEDEYIRIANQRIESTYNEFVDNELTK